jgi:hypothetical protein
MSHLNAVIEAGPQNPHLAAFATGSFASQQPVNDTSMCGDDATVVHQKVNQRKSVCAGKQIRAFHFELNDPHVLPTRSLRLLISFQVAAS